MPSISDINKVLSNLRIYTFENPSNMIHEQVINTCNGDYEDQGEEGETIRVFDVFDGKFFLKLNIGTDSYGDNEFVRSISIVQGKTKKVTVYEFEETSIEKVNIK